MREALTQNPDIASAPIGTGARGGTREEQAHKTPRRAIVKLASYDASWYAPGGKLRIALWYLCNCLIFKSALPFPSSIKRKLLVVFGAEVGRGVVIKPCVNIKYPWLLAIGDDVWIGENVWIDNLARVTLGSNVCISQGAYILTGNHDYKRTSFDLIVEPVVIEDGVWVGAKAVVCPGAVLRSHSVVAVGSVVSKTTEPYTIYRGNPARPVKDRELS